MAYPSVSWPLDKKELSAFLPPKDVLALTTNWDVTNHRRATLIGKRVTAQLTPDEESELKHLQELAGIIRNAGMRPLTESLSKIAADLIEKGVWRGE